MPQRTIYVKEEHQKKWEEAKRLVGDESLSEIIAEGLQRVIDARKNAQGNFKRIELELDDNAIAFQGREVASTKSLFSNSDHDHEHVAYVTPKGNILIYTEYGDNPFYIYNVYKSIAEASKKKDDDGEPLYRYQFLNDVAEAMGGKHFEELDI